MNANSHPSGGPDTKARNSTFLERLSFINDADVHTLCHILPSSRWRWWILMVAAQCVHSGQLVSAISHVRPLTLVHDPSLVHLNGARHTIHL